MKITVGICAYNVERYIRQCVSSVVKQTYKNIEIIIIDDGSLDKTGAILDEFAKEDERITVVHKKNEGHAAGREQIVQMMSGDAVYWVDSDDWIDEDAIKTSAGIMESTGADTVKTPIKDSDREYIGEYTRDAYMRILIPDKIHANVIGCLIKKEVYKGVHHRIGFSNEDFYIFPYLTDNAKKIVVEDSHNYFYRVVRPGSITLEGRANFKGYYPRAMHHADRFLKYNDEFPEETRIILKRFTDFACMASLYAEKKDAEKRQNVIDCLKEIEPYIQNSDDISAYKKWLVKRILSDSPVLTVLRPLHKFRGNMKKRKEIKETQTHA